MFDEMFHEALDMLMKEIRTSKHNYRTQMVEKTGLRCRITVSDVKVELQLYTRDYGMIFNLQYDKKTGEYRGLDERSVPFKKYLDTVVMYDSMGIV